MKSKLLSAVLCLIALCLSVFHPFYVFASENTIGDAKGIADGIIAYKLNSAGASNVQEWINGALSEKAGISSEWYVLALSQSGEYDLSGYCKALEEYIGKNTVHSASSKLKYALAFMAAGYDHGYISTVLDEAVGKQGIMSWIYGLHLITNGAEYLHGHETAVNTLLELQLSDGGWALTGTVSDVDVTAMAIQALAPYYEKQEVKNAVDTALLLLSSRQLADGDFASYGTPNAASVAQVITALSALGIELKEDSRFIKNGNNLMDGLLKYRLPNGGFCHRAGDAENDNASVQALYSLVAYIRMQEGKSGLYILDACAKKEEQEEVTEAVTESTEVTTVPPEISAASSDDVNTTQATVTDKSPEPVPNPPKSKVNYKLIACIVIAAACAVVCVVLCITGKGNRKNLIAVVIVAVLAAVFAVTNDFSTADSYYGDVTEKANAIGSVVFSVRCDTVSGKTESEYIPADGVILENTEFAIAEGDTVYDILIEAAKKYGIQVENSGVEGMAYITGINYLYEFQFGDLSGWVFLVNGERPSVGCDSYILRDKDVVEWLYTCELGNDLGSK